MERKCLKGLLVISGIFLTLIACFVELPAYAEVPLGQAFSGEELEEKRVQKKFSATPQIEGGVTSRPLFNPEIFDLQFTESPKKRELLNKRTKFVQVQQREKQAMISKLQTKGVSADILQSEVLKMNKEQTEKRIQFFEKSKKEIAAIREKEHTKVEKLNNQRLQDPRASFFDAFNRERSEFLEAQREDRQAFIDQASPEERNRKEFAETLNQFDLKAQKEREKFFEQQNQAVQNRE